jgi:hypothetical protein
MTERLRRLAVRFASAVLLLVAVTTAATVSAQGDAKMPGHHPVLPFSEANSWPLPDHDTNKALGTVTCASSTCHGSIDPWQGSSVLQNEYITWSRLDKHAHALEVLGNQRSMEIGRKLGIGDPTKAKICLDCHTDNRPEADRGPRFTISDGVGCEGCHGGSEGYIASHVAPGATHEDNLAHGMFPVDDPVARARLCLSCHFGNQDKLVTHRIMGAGHPRLSFEMETFSMIEPAHFRLRSDDQRHALLFDGVRIWAIGQAIAVSQTMKILMDPVRGHDGAFPELVLFDCHACHHPMSDRRWRPRTALGTSLPPGIPRLNDANMLMTVALARQIDPALGERVRNAAHSLEAALAGQGDVKAAAQALDSQALDVAQRVSHMAIDRAMLSNLTLTLIDEGLAGHYQDYSAAEQAVMAISSLVDFSNREGWLARPAEVNTQLSGIDSILSNDEVYPQDQFQNRLKGLRATLAQSN